MAAFTWQPPAVVSAPIVAVNIWPSTETLIAARESGQLSRGEINFVEMAWSSSAMRALGNHAVDTAVLSLNEALLLQEFGNPFKVILVVDESNGADAILGRPGLTSIADLRGKKVGVEVRSAGHYLLSRALETSGLALGDVQIIPLVLPETETAFDELGVDAVVTAEPWLTHLKRKNLPVLFDSSQIPDEICRVLVARDDTLNLAAGALKKLVDAHFAWLDRSRWPADLAEGIHRRENLTTEEFSDTFSRIRQWSKEDQISLLGGETPDLRRMESAVLGHMKQSGLISSDTSSVELPI
ncbi:MAG: ABC transporter substrate-binding protein, partial [Verrucomicrobiae bacterium]|nr:ABC transporter substrate-binding protein [Verrucomicrobiae bacterium]